MKILAGKWTEKGWVVALEGPGTEGLSLDDLVVVPFVARPGEYWASMRVICGGHFPVARLEGVHDGVSVAGLVGESVLAA